jgi:hypothetical protein
VGFFTLATRSVAIEPGRDGFQKILIPKRFSEKLYCSCLHRLHGHRNIAMARDKDDREPNTSRSKITLKVQPAASWQSHIKDQTGRRIRRNGFYKAGNRFKQPRLQSDGSQ